MNQLLLLATLTTLLSAKSVQAQTNEFFGVPGDELTVMVNGKEVTGEEKKARLLEMQKTESEMRLKGAGIGAQVARGKDGLPVIVKSLPDSAAAKAGLIQGDVIVAVDHEPTKGLAFTNVISLLRGEAGSTVTVAVSRLGLAEPFEVKLTREQIKYRPDLSQATGAVERTLIIRKGTQIPPELQETPNRVSGSD
jgi:C-terminal processing protease CtpA/Prc